MNAKREFFNIEPEQAIAILKLLHAEDATGEIEAMPSQISSEEIQAASQYKSRRPNLNFREMGIPIGSMLSLTGNDAAAFVVSEKQVRLGNEEMSLTAATRALLRLDYSVQPSPFWMYEGRSLEEIYEDTYSMK